jgi:protein SCO1/2
MPKILTSRWTLPVAGIVIGAAIILGVWTFLRPHEFGGILIQSPQPAYDFHLSGPQDQAYSLSQFKGKVVLLFFGYTFCPDVCPTALHRMVQVFQILGKQTEHVQAVFISVDPQRDNPAHLAEYLARQDSRILGLTGDLDNLTNIASQYGVFFEKRAGGTADTYFVDHTATLLLIDAQGYLRLVYSFETAAQPIAADIQYLLAHPR